LQLTRPGNLKAISNIFDHVNDISFDQTKALFANSNKEVFKEIYEKWDSVFAKDVASKLSNLSIKMINKTE
jgi:hypothetical protein